VARRIARACLAGLLAAGASPPGGAEAAPRVKVAVVTLAQRPDDVAGLARTRPVGDVLALAGGSVETRRTDAGDLLLGETGTRVVPGKPVAARVRVAPPGAAPGDGRVVTLALVFEKEDGAWRYRVASALHVKAGPREITLVDCDGDGSATGSADGVLVPDASLLVPVRSPLVAANVRWSLGACDLANPAATLSFEPLTADPLEDATLERLNRFRRTTGLPEVAGDAKASEGCRKHHAYVRKNGFDPRGDAHSEDPRRPLYTPEGHATATVAVLMSLDGPAAMEAWIRTHYHLAPFLAPGLARVGLATGSGFTVLDARTGVGAAPYWKAPCVRYPAPGQKDAGSAFWPAGEVPCPVPQCERRGHTVSVLHLPDSGGTGRPVGVTLRRGKEDVVLLPPAPDPTGTYAGVLGGGVPEAPLWTGDYEASYVPAPGAPPVKWSFRVAAVPPAPR
jgi:hypothetical protein